MRDTTYVGRSSRRTAIIIAAVSLIAALGVRLADFQNEPITDELYHLLAAQSWVQDGSFDVSDGSYSRAALFTMLIGVAHTVGGGDVDTIRIVCIVIGALLVAAVAFWTARHVNASAAVITSVLLAVLPTAIFLSQYIRFYSLHALLFFLMAACVWDLHQNARSSRRFVVSGLAAALAAVAIHLQVTTLVGIAGLATWLVLANYRAVMTLLFSTRNRWIVTTLAILALLSLALALRSPLARLIATYYESALWNTGDTFLYYFNLYRRDFGILWSLAPAAFIIALVARPAPAFFCTCIFVVAFVVQSLGGMRSERFMFYALPFFFIIWGIALDFAGRALIDWLRQSLATFGLFASRPVLSRALPIVAVIAVGLFAFALTPIVETAAKMTLGKRTDPPDYWDRYRENWTQIVPLLRQLRDETDVVVASQPLHAIYYLGDVDYVLNATMLSDFARPGIHAALDPRTGDITFDDVPSLRAVMQCHSSGVLIVHGPAFRNPTRIDQDIASFIESNLERIPVSGRSSLLVFRWIKGDEGFECRLHDGKLALSQVPSDLEQRPTRR